jgi:1-acyl-sn-glycerol-3-phosphate acyltransferase
MNYLLLPLSILSSLGMILVTFVSAILVLLAGAISRSAQDKYLIFWGRCSLLFTNIWPEVSGLENIPKDRGTVFVFNHASLLDILLIHGYVMGSFRFGAKAELFDIPLFGYSMRKAGALEVPRQNRSKAIEIYNRSVSRIHNGESFVLGPEGTRVAESKIGEFKSGPFILAIKAQCPVTPVVITGVRKILPTRSVFPRIFWKPKVSIQILAPIE